MEKLYNCEILDKNNILCDSGENEIYNLKLAESDSKGCIDFTIHNILNYTELYKNFKKKNNVKSYNKLPVHAYKFPKNTKNANFDELKREFIYNQLNKEAEKDNGKNEMNNENLNYYEGNLKILIPKDEKRQRGIIKKEKKSLREKIYDGDVMFYEDYIEQLAAKDYEYFFRKPYEIKRKDEGGKYYFYGKKMPMELNEDIYRKFYNLDDEYFIKKLDIKEKLHKNVKKDVEKEKKEEKEKILEKEYQKLSYEDRNFIQKIKEENHMQMLATYKFYKKNKNIFEKNLPEIKKKELLFGHIPDIILPANTRKTKHPKNCTVPVSSLHTYAKFIDDLFKCPYIYTAIDEQLGKYWKTNENEVIQNIKSEHIKKGYKKDIYSATKEQLQVTSEKLKNLLKNEESANNKNMNFTVKFKIQKKENKNKTVCNGRYVI
ncbi:apical exonemal protein, putative [Plasmodium malariae]|uniref:Apical exonemal protein, putative n=1 Tax=Plasmodium malariae TaxID=5858 RepID=A0A1C3KD02_PLAMA|nr:apical exonemal protein, putative [Plasmodium malariae]